MTRALLAVVFLTACTTKSGGAGATDGGAPVGEEILPPTVTRIVAQSAPGADAPPDPVGSDCSVGEEKYTLTVTTKLLHLERCQAGARPTDPYQLLEGDHTLSQDEYDSVAAAMKRLTLSKTTGCGGSDKAESKITVTTPASEKIYFDSFYQCRDPNRVYVDNMDAVFGILTGLVKVE